MDPLVATTRGRVRGTARDHDVAFLGIPYAQPPFGRLRFAEPTPVDEWKGVIEATKFAPTAPQPERRFTLIPEPIIDGGDAPPCLSLNVFSPLGAEGLPVLVWIHGGGFTAGTPSSPWYDGAAFTRDGVVVVSIGYRLGCEGFLRLDGAPANRGVLDCIAGLEWVHENIARFGGDPAKVTIGGQSAGGGMVTLLAAHARAAQLCRGVIAMSGTAMRLGGTERAARTAAKISETAGLPATLDAFATLDPSKLIEIQEAAHLDRSTSLGPTVDGAVVASYLPAAIDAGATATLPILAGATTEETVGPQRDAKATVDELNALLDRLGLDEAGRRAFRAMYPKAKNGELRARALTDSEFRVGPVRLAERRAAAGAAPTFLYETAWSSPGLDKIGAVHCIDVPFAFDCLDHDWAQHICGGRAPQAMADAMHGALVRFIASGQPGWPAYDPDAQRSTMVFDTKSSVVHDPHAALRAIWP
ncbi:MAG TPA: carboxylesterase family protein [Acidimicrobiales bacterium]|nr:carboxylesterase family protein [Acidimicrobiales bacterium]